MFMCCKKKKKKILPRKRADSYSEYLDVCIKNWERNNTNIVKCQVAPKPPTPISTMNKYIKKKIEKNKKIKPKL